MLSDQDSAVTSVLVTVGGAINTRTGGGQRTNLLFQALQQLGPVHVICLGGSVDDDCGVFFPGAAGFYPVHSPKAGQATPRGKLRVWTNRLARGASVLNYFSPDQRAWSEVRSILEEVKPDIIAARYFRTATVAGLLNVDDIPVLIDIDDRDDQKFETLGRNAFGSGPLFKAFEVAFLNPVRKYMARGLSSVSHIWVANDADREYLSAYPSISLLPNIPFKDVGSQEHITSPETDRTVVFVASEGHTPNREGGLWFMREVWPLVLEDVPDAQINIVGIGNWQKALAEFEGVPGLNVVGFVEEIEEGYRGTGVAVSPIVDGGGTKIKVLEAMAFGLPVVSTSHSLRGFTDEVVGTAFTADQPKAFAEALVRLLRNPELRAERGRQGRAAVEKTYAHAGFARVVREAVQLQVETRGAGNFPSSGQA